MMIRFPVPRILLLIFSCFWIAGLTESRAALIVQISNATIAAGGTGTADVVVRSDTPAGTSLSQFGFEFRIDTAGSTRLDFSNPQTDSQLASASYVFFGNSLAETVPPVGIVSNTVVPNDTFIGGDGTLDASDVLVPVSGLLLARLDVTTLTALPPQVGDTFTIALVAGLNTFFLDAASAPVAVTSVSGTVMIVPEPASGLLFALGLLLALTYRQLVKGR